MARLTLILSLSCWMMVTLTSCLEQDAGVSIVKRHGRDAENNTEVFPENLDLTITLNGKPRDLHLRLNKFLTKTSPIYGFVNKTLKQLNADKIVPRAMYQDLESGAAVHVEHVNSSYTMRGTVFDDGKMYQVTPRPEGAGKHTVNPQSHHRRKRNADIDLEAIAEELGMSGEALVNLMKGQSIDLDISTIEARYPGFADFLEDFRSQASNEEGTDGSAETASRKSDGDGPRSGGTLPGNLRIIPITIFADNTVYEYFQSKAADCDDYDAIVAEMELYYSLAINEIDLRFQSLRAHNPKLNIRVILSGMVVVTTEKQAIWNVLVRQASVEYVDARSTLGTLIVGRIIIQLRSTIKLGHLVATTRLDIGKRKNSLFPDVETVEGATIFSGMCLGPFSVSLVKDAGPHFGLAAAHSLGHSLGAYDDKEEGCLSSSNFVMTDDFQESVDPIQATHPWTFSSCTAAAIVKRNPFFLSDSKGRLGRRDCLAADSSGVGELEEHQSLPLYGQAFTFDDMCQNAFGVDASFCRRQDKSSVCRGIRCNVNGKLCSGVLPAPSGTACGQEKICYKGECTPLYQLYPGHRCKHTTCCAGHRCCGDTFKPWGSMTPCCHTNWGTCCVDRQDTTITCNSTHKGKKNKH